MFRPPLFCLNESFMAIKVTNQSRIARETKADFLFVDDEGEQKTEQIRVEYYSLSPAESRKYREGLKGEAYWSDVLLPILKALPDLEGEDGGPFAVTKENLETINGTNLQAIVKAIEEDANRPKSQKTT